MAGWRGAEQEPVASRHAIEQGMQVLVDVATELATDDPLPIVTACWQDEAYLDVPPGLLDRLAAVSHLTIACAGRPHLAPGVGHVPVEPSEALAEEWSIVAVTPSAGVMLVANEVPASLPARTLEDGRTFRYDATDDPRVVVAHARRLLRTFGARMLPEAAARFSAAATGMAERATDDHVDARTQPVHEAISAGDDARREHTALPSDTGGLAGLADWLADAGPHAPSLGIIVVRSDTAGLTSGLREHTSRVGRVGDIVVDVPPDAAMMVAPGLHGTALDERANEVCRLLRETLHTGDVDAVAVDVPAEHAHRDLVGSLGVALTRLRRQATTTP